MEERHRLLLMKQNPWWKNQQVTLPAFERDLLQEITQYLPYKQILAIVGLRRVGKTIMMKQLIHKIQEPPQNICYISFDDIDFQEYRIAEDLINYFLEYSEKNKRRYLFLDEIQKLPHWADLMKTYYDNEENLKIILSGSASLEVKKGKETLAGRILSFHLPVVSFSEYVRYFKKDHTVSTDNLFREYDLKFAEKKETYQTLWNEYLIKGAFPELFDTTLTEKEYIQKYIKESVIEKSIADIARITKEDEKLIYELFRLLANSNARLFEIINLANILKINRNRLSRCISLLEKLFLISIAYNYTASVAKQVRSNKKQYAAHSSLVIAILDYPFEVLTTELAGHLVEGVIATTIKSAVFWRTPQKDEVDIITKERVPIEVKYQSQITNNDIRSLLKFCKKFQRNKGIILTKNLMEKRTVETVEIYCLPAWFYSLFQTSLDTPREPISDL